MSSSPLKSPAQKKSRGDHGIVDDDQEMEEVQVPVPSTPQGARPASVTLDAIGSLLDTKLDEKLNPVNESLKKLFSDFNAFKESVRAELQSLGGKVEEIEKEHAKSASKIEALEGEIMRLKIGGRPQVTTITDERASTVVVGNIPGKESFDAAKEWLLSHCKSVGHKTPEIFYKTSYTGILFAKFGSKSEAIDLIGSISKLGGTFAPGKKNEDKIYAKVDKPIEIRTAEGTLFAIKRLLIEWGFSKSCVKIDTESSTLSVAGKTILSVAVDNYALIFKWCDGDWEKWDDLQNSEEFTSLKEESQGRLNKVKDLQGAKGKGKGPGKDGEL